MEELTSDTIDKLSIQINKVESIIPVHKEKRVILLGDTGVGKSSLITYLADPFYVFAVKNECEDFIIRAKNNPLTSITITAGTISGTTLPANWREYWDLPGFGDTRGPLQEILNAFSIYKVAKNSSGIKILMIETDANIRQNRHNFVKLVQNVENTFKDAENLDRSLCLVVSKNEKLDLALIKKIMQNILDQQTKNNSKFKTTIINSLLSPEGQIAFFHTPKQEGSIPDTDKNSILRAINQIVYLENPQPSINLSKNAKLYIKKLEDQFNTDIACFISGPDLYLMSNLPTNGMPLKYKVYLEKCDCKLKYKFLNCANEIGEGVLDIIVEGELTFEILTSLKWKILPEILRRNHPLTVKGSIIRYCDSLIEKHSQDIKNLRNQFGTFTDQFRSLSNEAHKLQYNLEVFLGITNKFLINEKNLQIYLSREIQRYEFLKLVDPDKWESQVHTNNWYNDISELVKHIGQLRKPPAVESPTNMHIILKGFLVGTSDLQDSIEKSSDILEVDVYSLNSLFIDLDITLPGMNLTLISPCWKIIGNKTISLKGIDGSSHSLPQAEEGVNPGGSGKDGLPGLPGGSGGNFYGHGRFFDDLSSLTIDVSGGNGGPGQIGGNGVRGQDGQDGDMQKIQNRDEAVLVKRKAVESQSWGDYAEKAAKFFLTFNGKFKETYETGFLGTSGSNSGKGGIGGIAGNAGSIVLNSTKFKVKKNNGTKGPDGQSGTPGNGGKNGKRCLGIYINEVIAPNVRGYTDTDVNTGINAGDVTKTGGTIGGGFSGVAVANATSQNIRLLTTRELVGGVVKTGGQVVYKKGAEAAITLSTKEVVKGTVRDVTVNQAGRVIANVGTSNYTGALMGFGIGFGVQAGGSVISAYLSSGWIDGPRYLQDEYSAPTGIRPTLLNENNINNPVLPTPIQQENKKNSYQLYCRDTENIFKSSLN